MLGVAVVLLHLDGHLAERVLNATELTADILERSGNCSGLLVLLRSGGRRDRGSRGAERLSLDLLLLGLDHVHGSLLGVLNLLSGLLLSLSEKLLALVELLVNLFVDLLGLVLLVLSLLGLHLGLCLLLGSLSLLLGVGDFLFKGDVVLRHSSLSLESISLPLSVGILVLDNIGSGGCRGSRGRSGSSGSLGSFSSLNCIHSGALSLGSGLCCLSLSLLRSLLGSLLSLLLLLLVVGLDLLSFLLSLGCGFGSFGLGLAVGLKVSGNLLGKSLLVC